MNFGTELARLRMALRDPDAKIWDTISHSTAIVVRRVRDPTEEARQGNITRVNMLLR